MTCDNDHDRFNEAKKLLHKIKAVIVNGHSRKQNKPEV